MKLTIANLMMFFPIGISLTHSFKCYRCASPYPINNWGRFKLPVFRGDEQQSDPACEKDHEVNSYVECTGLCLTINFTMPDYNHTLGIVRECHRLPAEEKELRTQSPCFTEEGTSRRMRRRVFVEYCYCQGDFCNGVPQLRTLRRGGLLFPRSSTSVILRTLPLIIIFMASMML